MEAQILAWFENSGIYSVLLSIVLNIIISFLGIVPSVFLTAANISFFGFGQGLLISILGEAFGAIFSFHLYRKGINKVKDRITIKNKYLKRLQSTQGLEAFFLIVALRIFPFIPSGVVTLVSASSKVGILNYSIASTLGKIPALLIEAYSVQQVLNWSVQGKIILVLCSIFMVVFLIKRFRKKTRVLPRK
ncbi:TVP38/TMEM64 family protein [Neobacillus rhizophilus]|uniref:TVP38/TMEM64 family membrane protein n=1 Tax=Neobacillus rhizophilus TaxID=2833579 RepID=A0A942U5F6_9BACI|nr:VTT domain-containing protein [Neobacillus rhizophilus]MBS4213202.1 TVP38/TMEM64 family protein [Neobacillus rhizophilus]MBU8914675.1 VTT domain-containing protein [Bacillus sp. FJAT-29953]